MVPLASLDGVRPLRYSHADASPLPVAFGTWPLAGIPDGSGRYPCIVTAVPTGDSADRLYCTTVRSPEPPDADAIAEPPRDVARLTVVPEAPVT